MFNLPDAAIGAILAAFIAGSISLLGLVISKEQKISDFRHAWLEALRSDLAIFLTNINAIYDAMQIKYEKPVGRVEALRPLYVALNNSNFNILLRVRPNDEPSQQMLNTMKEFYSLASDEATFTTAAIRDFENKMLAASRDLLKAEWERVKSGEKTFRWAKIIAIALIFSALSVAVFGASFAPKTIKGRADIASSMQSLAAATSPEIGTTLNGSSHVEKK
jgi:hypothetical protein